MSAQYKRGAGRKPGASSYKRKHLSLQLNSSPLKLFQVRTKLERVQGPAKCAVGVLPHARPRQHLHGALGYLQIRIKLGPKGTRHAVRRPLDRALQLIGHNRSLFQLNLTFVDGCPAQTIPRRCLSGAEKVKGVRTCHWKYWLCW
jgi:hypothetical protein